MVAVIVTSRIRCASMLGKSDLQAVALAISFWEQFLEHSLRLRFAFAFMGFAHFCGVEAEFPADSAGSVLSAAVAALAYECSPWLALAWLVP